jgi:hypothetical protein
MQRREFLQLSTAAGLSLLSTEARGADALPSGSPPQIYEIRTYHFATAEKRDAYAKFVGEAMIPALNRLGIQPVGVFTLIDQKSPEATDLWVFLPHESADEAYQTAGKEILLAGKNDPAFTRFDTQLLYAFASHPRLTPPPNAPGRIFELRVYLNPSEERALNKMKQFNNGEVPIFIKSNMPGVFFGEAFAGPDLPHLTYMVFHESDAASKKNWAAFRDDPDWKKLSAEPEYKDNVSKVISRFVKPSAGSQL